MTLYTRLFVCAIQKEEKYQRYGEFRRPKTQDRRRKAACCINGIDKPAGQTTFTSVLVGTCMAETWAEFPIIRTSNKTSPGTGYTMTPSCKDQNYFK